MKPRYDAATAVAHLRAADSDLADLMDACGPFDLRLHRTGDLFASLLRSIIYQQLHGKAAASIHGRVLALTGPRPTAEAIDELTDTQLRTAGLSAAKLAALRDLSAKTAARTVPSLAIARRMDDDELIARLTTVRGIGPWTVHMLLLFRLGRPDVMPTGDFAIRLAFARHFRQSETVTPAELLAHADRWKPWRSVASWYLWRSLDPAGGG
ncbi:DNA-3-methyladenine glycosylase family protein [Synoicihabitans lomoniglobus]|uniref:DNA-3-methyladenine glycosylase II n=1 Tax=Synoicihabitans lomoniglobus TaxID=2909285 RepID=A0AAF0CR38_9BACT|nr:hypothetical protein [Opitutaceae bacterium LMO-M01]WED66506.1 hypothetical protein PXH66_06545 [Opitutaceae bacterium LMO-M01]